MASKFPPPIRVDDLHNKLSVLLLHSRSINSYEALARCFEGKAGDEGLTAKAIKNWVVGDGSRDSNHVPARRFDELVKIVQRQLPDHRSVEESRALLLARNAAPLQWCFVDHGVSSDWYDLARNATEIENPLMVRLGELAITSTGLPLFDPVDAHPFPVRKRFRFDLNLGPDVWTVAIQWTRAVGWVVLPPAADQVVLSPSPGVSSIPGRRMYFVENEPQLTRYLFVRLATPVPGGLEGKLKLSAFSQISLEADALARLAAIINSDPANSIRKFDVEFFDPAGRV